jgi:hypothetical protein
MTTAERNVNEQSRRVVGAILTATIAALVVLAAWNVSVLEARRELSVETEVLALTAAQYEPDAGQPTLSERIVEETLKQRSLLREWARYSNLLGTWQQSDRVSEAEGGDAARIDYKVELYNARRRLAEKAQYTGAQLPVDLGIRETIGAEEDASVRLLQLATVEKLVGLTLDTMIPRIDVIDVLPPRDVPAADGGEIYLSEYPVRMQMQCSHAQFVRLLGRVAHARHFFTVSHVMAEKASFREPDLLNVTVVFHALVLKEGLPSDVVTADEA